MSYKAMLTFKDNANDGMEGVEIWQVSIRNVGLGAALISRSEFTLETSSMKNKPSFFSFDEAVKKLAEIGLVCGDDYWLANMTDGFTLPSKEDYIVFQIKTEHIQKIKRLDMLLHFQGFLNDKYIREVFFIPQDSIKSFLPSQQTRLNTERGSSR